MSGQKLTTLGNKHTEGSLFFLAQYEVEVDTDGWFVDEIPFSKERASLYSTKSDNEQIARTFELPDISEALKRSKEDFKNI